MTVAMLKEELTARGLSTKGLKKDLVERLEEALASISEDIADTEEKIEDVTEEKIEENKEEQANVDDDAVDYEQPEGDSSVVHIRGFVRPFTLAAAKDLVSQFGEIKSFWMNAIKSHAFVDFEESSAAQACVKTLNGLQWPAETGRPLSADFSLADAMEEAIEADKPVDERKRKVPETPSAPVESVEQPDTVDKPIASAKTLDELFLKTTTKPHLYYLPRQV